MNLTPDTFYSVALKLDGGELMKMCSTDNATRRICVSEKFNPVWIQKLKQDFNVDYSGNNAYMEYLQNAYLYKQKYWVATVFNKNDNEVVTAKIFKNRSDAALFLSNEAIKFYFILYHQRNPNFNQAKHFVYLSNLEESGLFEDRWNKYEIIKSKFETQSQNNKNYNNYISALKNLYDIINPVESFDEFKSGFQTFISEEDDDYDFESFMKALPPIYKKLRANKMEQIEEAFRKIMNLKNIYPDQNESDEE